MIKSSNRIAFILLVLGFLMRLAFVELINPIDRMLWSDMGNYIQISEAILRNEWKPTHFFQPIGFPYILLLLKTYTMDWLGWLKWIHLFTATASLFFFWKTVKEAMGEKIGLISLFLGSAHFSWIAFTGFVLSENTFIFLLSVLAWLSLRLIREQKVKWAALWAFVFFIAFLIKGTHVFLAPLLILGLFYYYRMKAAKLIAVIGIILSVGLLSHGLFTLNKIGKFQMSASAGGLNFVEGKCPVKNNADSLGYSWLSPLYLQMGKTAQKRWNHPFTDSQFFMNEGLKCIVRRPSVLIQSFESIPFLFTGNILWPAIETQVADQMRLYELYFGCFLIVGLICYFIYLRSLDDKSEAILMWILPIVSVFICVYIFKSEIRFRVPFDVWFIPVAVKGWDFLLRTKSS